MVNLETKPLVIQRVNAGKRNTYSRIVCCCSGCKGTIYMPKDNIIYYYCYTCGEKFNEPVTAEMIAIIRKKE